MSPDHGAGGVSRRTWRTAAVVFLTVFLGGLCLAGANALWSQQGTVQATVTTGTWGPQDIDWTPDVLATDIRKDNGSATFTLMWKQPAAKGTWSYSVSVEDATSVVVSRTQPAAFIVVENGVSCFPLSLQATNDDGTQTAVKTLLLKYHPSGPNGSVEVERGSSC
ncbi:hypothetical protein [Citricoccus muralis]|uniref:Uncharacterized protein n=1 Tax=Citricoccus muralis TaxID=169134 RepID=A0A3D9LBH7_9MICC|nr:hypothetical protein [Citricoccus muralis]REE03718.1 hypothetical protein C8E99_1534 [Citricoccus muralis]